jgi:membrane protease YdiL (CAAX protease family)
MTPETDQPAAVGRPPAPPVPFRWTDALLVLLLAVLGAAVLQPLVGALRLGAYGQGLLLLLIAALTGVLTWVVARRRYGDQVRLLLGHRRATGRDVLVGLGAAVVGVVGVIALVQLLTLGGRPPDVQQELRDAASNPATLPLMALAAVVVVPIAEELLYRGMLFQALRMRLGRWPAIGLSGLVFGLLHAQGTLEGTLLLLAAFYPFGMWLAWLFDRRGTLVTSIVCHMAYNGANLALFLSGR